MTSMQLMLKYLEDEGLENTGAYYKAKLLFENKEKKDIIETFCQGYYEGKNDSDYTADEYYRKLIEIVKNK